MYMVTVYFLYSLTQLLLYIHSHCQTYHETFLRSPRFAKQFIVAKLTFRCDRDAIV